MECDLVIIGGGPSGMIAGGRVGEKGSSVVLLEKNNKLGRKLLITGKGRCNITNAEKDLKSLINSYGKNGKFLYPSFNNFSNQDTIRFFNKLGLKTKTERGNRVFPISDNSDDVLGVLENYLRKNNVDIKTNSEVNKIVVKNNKIEKIVLKNNKEIIGRNYLIATGGKSYPITGSTGDGYRWLKNMGHKIVEPNPVLTPLVVKEKFVKELEGLSLKNVEVSLWNNKKILSLFGEALFTSDGLSGPVILNLSKIINNANKKDLKIKIDFKPALTYPKLDKRIQRDFVKYKSKQFKNSLDDLLPQKLIPVVIKLSKIKEDKKVSEISKIERKRLIKLLKEFELSYDSLVGFEKAVVTEGGVSLKEIDPKTMRSKLIDNLYIAGELLDLDGPTGGYNLQIAWSTGYLVGDKL